MSIPASRVRIKRAYAAPAPEDGVRVLVDRLWPRGLARGKASIDEWIKDVAPSTALRQWFGHDAAHWQGFRERYLAELQQQDFLIRHLRALAREGPLTLLYAARDSAQNNAVVLRERILGR